MCYICTITILLSLRGSAHTKGCLRRHAPARAPHIVCCAQGAGFNTKPNSHLGPSRGCPCTCASPVVAGHATMSTVHRKCRQLLTLALQAPPCTLGQSQHALSQCPVLPCHAGVLHSSSWQPASSAPDLSAHAAEAGCVCQWLNQQLVLICVVQPLQLCITPGALPRTSRARRTASVGHVQCEPELL